MAKDALLRLRTSILFKTLLKKEIKEGFQNLLSSKVEIIVESVSDLLHRIPEHMPEYTLHDPNHSSKIIEIIGKFLPAKTLQTLNSIELTLVILSAYLHDIGMTSTTLEREDIIANDQQYSILFKTLSDKRENYEYYKSIGDHRAVTFIEDQVFTEYLRRNHVVRSATYIKDNLSSGTMLLEINGIPFWKHLITICNGHGEPVKSIADKINYPINTLVGEKIINIQFLSLILRLGDILDLDPERTPKIIYEFINPQDPTSITEWKKHRSIIGNSITPEKIVFEGECSSPEVERALKLFIHWIEIERKQTMQLLKDSNSYELRLSDEITSERIRSDGTYIYNDLKFEIDYQRVLELLMGQRLYKSTFFSIRELLQNAIDAIKARDQIYVDRDEKFEPKVKITLSKNTLSIEDNGIGMDDFIFRNYFLQIGRSYYSSPDFYSKNSEIDVTSEFGIGVLSVFMIASSLTVESRREPDLIDNPPKPIFFEIPTAHSYTIQRSSVKNNIGTKISLKLKSKSTFTKYTLLDILSEIIPFPPFPITIDDNEEIKTYTGLEQTMIEQLPIELEKSRLEEFMVNDLERESKLKYSHRFLTVEFSKSELAILRDIKGRLNLVNSGRWNWYSIINGFFCQRNFSIGGVSEDIHFKISTSKNINQLFPNWLSYESSLNLNKLSSLSVTPDRTDVIVDDKYITLKNAIEVHLINDLTEHLDEILKKTSRVKLYSYVDLLLSTGFINIDLDSREQPLSVISKKFLSDIITFPTIDNIGNRKRMKCSNIKKYSTVAYIEHSIEDSEIPKILSSFSGDNDFIIIELSKMSYSAGWFHRIEPIMFALITEEYRGNGCFFRITSLLPKFTIELIKYKNKTKGKLDYDFCLMITDTLSSEDSNILCLPRSSRDFYMTFNIQHPLISVLMNEEKKLKKEANKIISFLQEILRKSIETSIRQRSQSDGITLLLDAFQTDERIDIYKLTNGIILGDNAFLKSLNSEIKTLWNVYIEHGFVKENIQPYQLEKHDFPISWFTK
jgi:hypothetical protein